jgi:hypothetical protein
MKIKFLLACGLASYLNFDPTIWRWKDGTQLLMYTINKKVGIHQ